MIEIESVDTLQILDDHIEQRSFVNVCFNFSVAWKSHGLEYDIKYSVIWYIALRYVYVLVRELYITYIQFISCEIYENMLYILKRDMCILTYDR